jgi:hypothetical protein
MEDMVCGLQDILVATKHEHLLSIKVQAHWTCSHCGTSCSRDYWSDIAEVNTSDERKSILQRHVRSCETCSACHQQDNDANVQQTVIEAGDCFMTRLERVTAHGGWSTKNIALPRILKINNRIYRLCAISKFIRGRQHYTTTVLKADGGGWEVNDSNVIPYRKISATVHDQVFTYISDHPITDNAAVLTSQQASGNRRLKPHTLPPRASKPRSTPKKSHNVQQANGNGEQPTGTFALQDGDAIRKVQQTGLTYTVLPDALTASEAGSLSLWCRSLLGHITKWTKVRSALPIAVSSASPSVEPLTPTKPDAQTAQSNDRFGRKSTDEILQVLSTENHPPDDTYVNSTKITERTPSIGSVQSSQSTHSKPWLRTIQQASDTLFTHSQVRDFALQHPHQIIIYGLGTAAKDTNNDPIIEWHSGTLTATSDPPRIEHLSTNNVPGCKPHRGTASSFLFPASGCTYYGLRIA